MNSLSDIININPVVEVLVELECNDCGGALRGRTSSRRFGDIIEVEVCKACRDEFLDEHLFPTYEVLHTLWYQKMAEKGYTSFIHPEVRGDDQELLRDWPLLSPEAREFLTETPYLTDKLSK